MGRSAGSLVRHWQTKSTKSADQREEERDGGASVEMRFMMRMMELDS